jgi:hypothetical protein
MASDPVQRYVLQILYQATHDGADEILVERMRAQPEDIDPADQARREEWTVVIKYKVSGVYYDFASMPSQIRSSFVNKLFELANVPEDSAFPKAGIIEFKISGLPSRWELFMESAGDSCVLRLSP